MFIELTNVSGVTFSVNINNIIAVEQKGDQTSIELVDSFHSVEESYDQVKELIKNEVAAERGY